MGLVGVTTDLRHQITSEVIKNAHSEPKKIPFLVNFGVKCGVFVMAMVNVEAVEVWGFGAGTLGVGWDHNGSMAPNSIRNDQKCPF